MADLDERIRGIAKAELHQHVDGSIPAEVTWELMRHYRLNPVDTLDEMRRRLELQDDEEGTLLAYLDKMHYPLWITQFYENISRVTPRSSPARPSPRPSTCTREPASSASTSRGRSAAIRRGLSRARPTSRASATWG
jgi:hypothetical protein